MVAQQQVEKLMSIPQPAFSINKNLFRNKYLQQLRDNREQDIDRFVNMAQKPEVQKVITTYLENLKKK